MISSYTSRGISKLLTDELCWCYVEGGIVDPLPWLRARSHSLGRYSDNGHFPSLDVPSSYLSGLDTRSLLDLDPVTLSAIYRPVSSQ
jgi:hypothetical protein